MLSWIKYSGLAVVFTLNPLHWRLVPDWGRVSEWPSEETRYVTWLCVTIRVWIDDGSW